MTVCHACGAESSAGAKFCPECGAPLAAAAADRREVRKTVTVLFSDLAGSTELGEALDPERLRALMSRYFAEMRAVIERHGGTVEKFIGDAIMAVFGIPTLHEDDALRAVRAASEMREALRLFNDEAARSGGVQIQSRTGVNTGEVVASADDDGPTMATGDAVNTAARLEQLAAPGEVLLGASTWGLVRDAVTVEALEPMTAKGKADPISAYRLVSVAAGVEGRVRRMDAPLIGREPELRTMHSVWESVIDRRAPHVLSLLGTAGVGKSRLVREFIASLAGATVIRGRCLPYGEGITYWPLAEVLRGAAGIDESHSVDVARTKLEGMISGERDAALLADPLLDALGLATTGATQEEITWAARRTLEALARRRPLVTIWDDIQWAEPAFLGMIEQIAMLVRDAPLLVVAMARPELLELRPDWGGATPNSTVIMLEPLDGDAAHDLIASLPGGPVLPGSLRRRIVEAAEGNPLYVEEMLGMLVDEGRLVKVDGGWEAAGDVTSVTVPPTINALLAARLERLPESERGVAERASVVGRVFERGAVVALSPEPDRPGITACLIGLVRKELLHPDAEPGLGGDDAYRFRHLLIRDAAYGALPKAERADLHERFAGWLERVAGDRLSEYEEILAYHLHESHRYRVELGQTGPSVDEIGRRAAVRYAAAAKRAQARGDMPAAVGLYRQAVSLPMEALAHATAQLELAMVLTEAGEWSEASDALDSAQGLIGRLGDERLDGHLAVLRGKLRFWRERPLPHVAIERAARDALPVFERVGDQLGQARAWDLIAFNAFERSDYDLAGRAWRTADEHVRLADQPAEEARLLSVLPATSTYGNETTSESIRYCEGLIAERTPHPTFMARVTAFLAWLHAERGEWQRCDSYLAESRRLLTDLAVPWLTGETHMIYCDVASLRGDWQAAEEDARTGYRIATEHGLTAFVEWGGLALAEPLFRQNKLDELGALLGEIRQANDARGEVNAYARAMLRLWQARLAAVHGDADGARTLLTMVREQDLPAVTNMDQSFALPVLAETLAAIGDWNGAAETLERLLEASERRESFEEAARARRMLAAVAERRVPAPAQIPSRAEALGRN